MKMPSTTFATTTIVAIASTIVLLALGACSRSDAAPEPVRAVRTLTVSADSAGGVHEYAAEIKARVESRVGFRVAGKMARREVEVGQRVQAGQVLARLDPDDLRLAEAAAHAATQAAQTNYELAESDLKRYKDLLAQGFVSPAEIDRRETTLKAARAQLEQAKAQANVQVNQATYAALTATAPGVITAVEAEPGTVLAAGTPVLRVAYDGPRDAVFAVPEDAISRVRALLGKAGGLKVKLWGAAAPLPATVREIAAAADPATRTFQVKADLANADVQLGRTATVLVDLPRLEGIAKLPLTAVTQQRGQTAVWVVDKDAQGGLSVRVQPIAVGGADGNSVVVTDGIKPGEVVVTAGVHVLNPGQKVKIYQEPVATAR